MYPFDRSLDELLYDTTHVYESIFKIALWKYDLYYMLTKRYVKKDNNIMYQDIYYKNDTYCAFELWRFGMKMKIIVATHTPKQK